MGLGGAFEGRGGCGSLIEIIRRRLYSILTVSKFTFGFGNCLCFENWTHPHFGVLLSENLPFEFHTLSAVSSAFLPAPTPFYPIKLASKSAQYAHLNCSKIVHNRSDQI